MSFVSFTLLGASNELERTSSIYLHRATMPTCRHLRVCLFELLLYCLCSEHRQNVFVLKLIARRPLTHTHTYTSRNTHAHPNCTPSISPTFLSRLEFLRNRRVERRASDVLCVENVCVCTMYILRKNDEMQSLHNQLGSD